MSWLQSIFPLSLNEEQPSYRSDCNRRKSAIAEEESEDDTFFDCSVGSTSGNACRRSSASSKRASCKEQPPTTMYKKTESCKKASPAAPKTPGSIAKYKTVSQIKTPGSIVKGTRLPGPTTPGSNAFYMKFVAGLKSPGSSSTWKKDLAGPKLSGSSTNWKFVAEPKTPSRDANKTGGYKTPSRNALEIATTPSGSARKIPPLVLKTPNNSCKKTPNKENKTPAGVSCKKTPNKDKKTPAGGVCKTPLPNKPLMDPFKTPPNKCGPNGNCPGSIGRTPIPSIIHKKLELTDPNPDPVRLFHQFNIDFFQSKLSNVEVKWNSRMTQCAGICHFIGKRGGCRISLSVPLLALRTRKDLIETLLHEMIHAYLFIVDGNREREEHGPKFLKHMDRINSKAGCNIRVEHDFLCEVDYYRAHVWRCTGPCRDNPEDDDGIIRRSINRPPGPSDSWWAEHERTCKGKFVKISQPAWKPSCLK